jgi:hypothetical protein
MLSEQDDTETSEDEELEAAVERIICRMRHLVALSDNTKNTRTLAGYLWAARETLSPDWHRVRLAAEEEAAPN